MTNRIDQTASDQTLDKEECALFTVSYQNANTEFTILG